MTDVVTIDVYSDVVCPWCYIGKRKLEQALVRLGEQNRMVTPNWRAFQLNPDMPSSGMARKDYVAAKFGGPERAEEIYARVTAAGNEVGLAFQFDKIEQQPNTLNAHRLFAYALKNGDQNAIAEALFRAFFLEFRNIGDIKALSDIAAENDLDRAAVKRYLESDEDEYRVRNEDVMARQLGIAGVPFFVFGGKYAVSGAQSADALCQAYQQTAAELLEQSVG